MDACAEVSPLHGGQPIMIPGCPPVSVAPASTEMQELGISHPKVARIEGMLALNRHPPPLHETLYGWRGHVANSS